MQYFSINVLPLTSFHFQGAPNFKNPAGSCAGVNWETEEWFVEEFPLSLAPSACGLVIGLGGLALRLCSGHENHAIHLISLELSALTGVRVGISGSCLRSGGQRSFSFWSSVSASFTVYTPVQSALKKRNRL